jgi:hypothetical protein
MATKRTCEGTTKKGKPCGANPLKPGTVIGGVTVTGKWCRQHDLDLPDSARIGGATPGAGRPRKPREVDVIRESLEARAGMIDEMLREAMLANRAVVVGNGPTAHMEMVPDWPTRITAAREILDRSYGRSKQSSEVTVITEDALTQAITRLEAELAGNDPTGPEHPAGADRALQAVEGAG